MMMPLPVILIESPVCMFSLITILFSGNRSGSVITVEYAPHPWQTESMLETERGTHLIRLSAKLNLWDGMLFQICRNRNRRVPCLTQLPSLLTGPQVMKRGQALSKAQFRMVVLYCQDITSRIPGR